MVLAVVVLAVTKRGQLWYWLWLCWQSLKGVSYGIGCGCAGSHLEGSVMLLAVVVFTITKRGQLWDWLWLCSRSLRGVS